MSTKRKSHKDVDFEVSSGESSRHFKNAKEALAAAAETAVGRGSSVLDVVVHSASGARWLYGEHGVEMYREDPDASVFERVEFRANNVGRVP